MGFFIFAHYELFSSYSPFDHFNVNLIVILYTSVSNKKYLENILVMSFDTEFHELSIYFS